MTPEAFVYIWYDIGNQKYYIGSRKGRPDDGYVCSSQSVLKEYKERPWDFFREIVAEGPYEEMRSLESEMQQAANAAKNPMYYNQHNSDGKFHTSGPMSEEQKQKMRGPRPSMRGRRKPLSEEHKKKLSLRGLALGEKNPAKRPEVRKKISENNAMYQPEARRKQSRRMLDIGDNHPAKSQAAREAQSKLMKERWANYKANPDLLVPFINKLSIAQKRRKG